MWLTTRAAFASTFHEGHGTVRHWSGMHGRLMCVLLLFVACSEPAGPTGEAHARYTLISVTGTELPALLSGGACCGSRSAVAGSMTFAPDGTYADSLLVHWYKPAVLDSHHHWVRTGTWKRGSLNTILLSDGRTFVARGSAVIGPYANNDPSDAPDYAGNTMQYEQDDQ